MRKLALVGLLALMVVIMAADTALALQPHQRDRWMAGIGLGVGLAKLGLLDPSGDLGLLDTDWEEGATAQIRFGWIFVPDRLMVSFENKQWLDEQGAPEEIADDRLIKLRASVQHFSLALTVFPGSPAGPSGGLFLKAGAGIGNARFTVLRPSTEEEQEASGGDKFTKLFINDDNGLALFAELGYELRIWSSLGAGLVVGFNYLDLDGDVYQDVKNTATTLSLNWYF